MPFKKIKPENLFQCQKCGDCCKGYGGTYVSEDDIKKISSYIGTPAAQFISQYCCMSNNKPLLAQRADGYCIFWNDVCTIHPVKPKMCKDWPFISSVLVDPNNWNLMSSVCPGIRTNYPDEVIADCIKRIICTVNEG
jgi:uncharacterized protein